MLRLVTIAVLEVGADGTTPSFDDMNVAVSNRPVGVSVRALEVKGDGDDDEVENALVSKKGTTIQWNHSNDDSFIPQSPSRSIQSKTIFFCMCR